jgi:hypothetical protein
MRAATVTIARLGMCISGELPQPGRYTSVTAEWPTIQGAMRFRESSDCAPVGLPPNRNRLTVNYYLINSRARSSSGRQDYYR